ncbi:MAG TPA: glycosyltransferase family 87 protein [Acidimicrobiia bacterium]|nr:glycosyltransferase family 87 protein [Acidimicrobiia bacterium]
MFRRSPIKAADGRRAQSSHVMVVVAVLLIAARVAAVPISLSQDATKGRRKVLTGDVARFHTIALHRKTPYRDFPVEYPPLMLGAIEALDGGSLRTATVATMWSQLLLDLGVAALLFWGWGRRTAFAYLLIGLPFIVYPFLYLRLDLLSVALAVGGLALVRRRRPALGGAALALACFAKIWPVLLAPGLLVRRSWRAVAAFTAVGVAGMVGWVAWAGTDGPIQVLSMRGATGWEIESTVGAVVRAVTGDRVHIDHGAWRAGLMPGWASPLLGVMLFAAVVATWVLADRNRPHGAGVLDGTAALAAIGSFLLFSPLLSPQFLIWLVPFAAIVAARGDWLIGRLALVIVALSVVDLNVIQELVHTNSWWPQAIVLGRNVLLVTLVGICLARLVRGARRPALGLAAPAKVEAAA